jgi:ribonuclease Z
MTDQLKIVFLGTGAAVPSITRGLPALAIIRENKCILCDCGEGTQLKIQHAGLSPSKIHTICISHMHGDHIFGLPGFITSQQLFGRTAPLTIYGPPGISNYLKTIAEIAKYKIEFPLSVVELDPDNASFFQVDEFSVTSKNLDHSSVCLGYRFEESPRPGKFDSIKADELGVPQGPLRSQLQKGEDIKIDDRQIRSSELVGPSVPGRIITYCTDTRPCETTRELAQDCDLLIHDSTFSDAWADKADPTFHTTSRNAAKMARTANARQLALWHLSIRVHGEEEAALLAQAQEEFPNTVLPNDLDEIFVPRRGAAG